jgi:ParB/RepB/Spo0J family partition protein
MSRLLTVPISKVKPNPDNPRGSIDTTTEPFQRFVATVRSKGVLQPLLVGPEDDNGEFTVIAGSRRYFGAVEAELAEVPVMSIDAEGEELLLAAIENEQRENLTPMAQARQLRRLQDELELTQVQAAEAMGKSERWARNREILLRLPERTSEAFDEKVLPLETLPEIAKVADAAPLVADALAEAATGEGEINKPVRDAIAGGRTHEAIDFVARRAAENPKEDGSSGLGCCLVPLPRGFGGRYEISKDQLVLAGVSEGLMSKIKERLGLGAKLVRQASLYAGYFDRVTLDSADVDAANSYGCLLSVEGRLYITDAEWLGDRFLERLNEQIERAESLAKQRGVSPTKLPSGAVSASEPSPDAEEEARQRRRAEREAETEKRAKVRANNLELGQRSKRALATPALTLEEEKLLALKVVGQVAPELGASGLIYCYHDYQDADGGAVSYTGGGIAGNDLIAQIKGSRRKGEPLGHALRALLLSEFADEECVARSNRSGYLPSQAADSDVPDLLATIAEKRKILPDEVRERIEVERHIRREQAEGLVLDQVQRSRAKKGVSQGALLKLSGSSPELIGSLVEERHLKEHEGEEEFTYTIMAGGKKRLEKLRAAEKERAAA